MAYRIFTRFVPLIFIAALGHPAAMGQESTPTRAEAKRAEAERMAIKSKLEAALDRDYEQSTPDELLMLSLQHSDIAVPELKRRLTDSVQQRPKTLARNSTVQADALAYVANDLAVDALAELCAQKSNLFCTYLRRTLDYAEGRVNPFSLVYHALGNADAAVQDAVSEWINGVIGFPHFQRRLAEAMLDRYGKAPSETDWAHDQIASRLGAEQALAVKDRVLSVASEIERNRSQRQRQ